MTCPRSHGEAIESPTYPPSEGGKGQSFGMKVILWHEDILIKLVLIWHLPCAEPKLGLGRRKAGKSRQLPHPQRALPIWGDKVGLQEQVKSFVSQKL